MHELLQVLLANLDGAYQKHGWHGPTLRGALRGLRAEDVSWRPATGRHNIWELTAHAAYWKYVARRRLTGVRTGKFPMSGSNFIPAPVAIDDASWQQVLRVLDEEHRLLRQVIAVLTDAELRDGKKLRMVYGVAAHDVYHTGQIQLLKRLRQR